MNLAILHHRHAPERDRRLLRDGVLRDHESSVHVRMDAGRGPDGRSGPAGPLRGPAARVAILGAAAASSAALHGPGGPGPREFAPGLAPTAFQHARAERANGFAAVPTGRQLEAQSRAVRLDRRPVPDHSCNRPAAFRRPAADRGRCTGRGVGRRGRADGGQGPLAARPQHLASTTSATTAAARTSTRAS